MPGAVESSIQSVRDEQQHDACGTACQVRGLEKRLWQSPETRGLLADTDVDSRVGLARYYLGSSWAPPSPWAR